MNNADNKEPFPAPQPRENPVEQSARNPGPKRRFLLLLGIVIVIGLIVGFIPRWLEHRKAISTEMEMAIPVVSVVSPVWTTNTAGLILPAEIRPWLEASIYAQASGYLKDWLVDIGAHVQAGQLLAEIESPDLDQQLDQAKAELVLAQANLELAEITDKRYQLLLKTASVSKQEAAEKSAGREIAAASVQADLSKVRGLEQLVSFERVVAPFKGTITVRNVDNGDLIVAGAGGKQLFHIAQTDKLRVYVRVPETFASAVAPGQTGTLTTPVAPGKSFTATVITSSESISGTSRTLLVELELDNSQHQLLPYSFGQVNLKQVGPEHVLSLPSNTLIFRAQGLQVAVVRPDSTVELRSIQVGRDFGQTINILGGVITSDRVVVNPPDSLMNGSQVQVQTQTQNTSQK
ncbi:MAG TPA: efflux RND transporter periplasmic adaptor subunit [Candidatus Sulfotelmatobacter sp.]|nr:efflux RND transporter periplasmic adaptor subunit [Candidatus Sulfotelmatobacter sp.]